MTKVAWFVHKISVLVASASREGSDESYLMRGLFRAFSAPIHKVGVDES